MTAFAQDQAGKGRSAILIRKLPHLSVIRHFQILCGVLLKENIDNVAVLPASFHRFGIASPLQMVDIDVEGDFLRRGLGGQECFLALLPAGEQRQQRDAKQ